MSAPRADCSECGGAGWVFLAAANEYGTVIGVEASCPSCCGPAPAAVLDWREAHGWTARPSRCRYCGRPTHLRDERQRPAHRHCAEAVRALSGAQGVAR